MCMKTMLNVKVDKDIKKEAQTIIKELGLTMSSVMNNALREVVRKKSVTFGEPPYIPNAKTARELLQASKDIREGKNMSPMFDNVEDAIAFLNKDPDERDWV